MLDPSGKQLLQWPIEEVEALRGKKVELSNKKLVTGQKVEIKGVTSAQVQKSLDVMNYVMQLQY